MYNFDRMNLTSESIDKLLKDPKTTVEDLLKEEELLQELRSQNEKLIDYFDKDKVKRLLDYIIKEQEDEKDKGYKFPFLCSQIFGLEIDKIMKYFFITNKQIEEEQKENEKKEKEEKEKEKKDSDEEEENNKNREQDNNKKEENENIKKEEKKVENKEDNKPEEEKVENKEEKKEEKKEEDKKDEEDKNKSKEEEVKKDEVKEEKKEEVNEEKKEDNKEETKVEVKEEQNSDNKDKEKEEKENEEDKNEEGKKEGEEDKKSEPESKENKIDLLDYFFQFLPEESDQKLNYVLSGYFSSLIVNLLSLNPLVFLKYIYKERSDVLDRMVTHCYRKSISDTLSKLLHFENYLQNEPLDEETKKDMIETRNFLFSDIFEKISIDMDNEDLNSIYFFITGLFDPLNINEEKDIFIEIAENKRAMKALIAPLKNLDIINYTEDNYEQVINKRKNFSTIIDIIIFFLTNIKKLKLDIPKNDSDSKFTIQHPKLSGELFDNLENLIKNNFNKKNDGEKSVLQCFNECSIKPLGEYKIKIVDLLCNLFPYFKNISKFYDEILINSEFFKNAFDYLFEYEWNNLYQDSFLNLLREFLNDANDHELLQEHLINQLTLFDKIKKYTNQEDKFKFIGKDSKPISHGYFSFLVSLSYKINTVMGGPTVIMKDGVLRQGSFTFISKVPEEGDKQGAMDMLYGGVEDVGNDNEKKKEEEEKKENFDSMQKYITDDWRTYFDENISKIITQYENKTWPEVEKKNSISPFEKALDDENKNENNNNEEEAANRRVANIFGDDDDEDKGEDRGRDGVKEVGENRDEGANFFAENNKENEENVDNNMNINVDAFEFDDKNNEEEKKKGDDINKEEDKNKEKINNKEEKEINKNYEEKKEEEKKKEEKKEEEKKEEEKKEEEKKEEEKKDEEKKDEEKKVEEKKEEKVEENKTEPDKKEDAKPEESKVEQDKTEDIKVEKPKLTDDKKEEDKNEENTKKEDDKKEDNEVKENEKKDDSETEEKGETGE